MRIMNSNPRACFPPTHRKKERCADYVQLGSTSWLRERGEFSIFSTLSLVFSEEPEDGMTQRDCTVSSFLILLY